MNQNSKAISIPTILLIIAILAIIVMGVFLLKTNKEKENELQNAKELQFQVDELNEKIASTKGRTFPELMDILYIKDKTELKGEKQYSKSTYDKYDGDFGDLDLVSVLIAGNKIDTRVKGGMYRHNVINGIDNEEIVDAKIDFGEDGPRGAIILTREGNLYYINIQSIYKCDNEAKKISGISEVIKIERVEVVSKDNEISECIMATKFDGTRIGVEPKNSQNDN